MRRARRLDRGRANGPGRPAPSLLRHLGGDPDLRRFRHPDSRPPWAPQAHRRRFRHGPRPRHPHGPRHLRADVSLEIDTVEMHTGGEAVRLVVAAYPPILGPTILAKRRYAREQLDHLRRLLMFEPRGHY